MLKKFKYGKVPGHYTIKPEPLKLLNEGVGITLHKILNLQWKIKNIPYNWKLAIIVSTRKNKKGDATIDLVNLNGNSRSTKEKPTGRKDV